MISTYDNTTIMIIIVVFILAGFTKGLVGLGLPPVVLGLLTAFIGIHPAMSMVVLPSLVTNTYQAVSGGNAFTLSKKLFIFYFSATFFVIAGCLLATQINTNYTSIILGLLLGLYGIGGLLNIRISFGDPKNKFIQLLLGTSNGIFTGLTGSSAVPGVFFLQSMKLSKEQLIQGMGILFTLSSITLAIGLYITNIFSISSGLMSLLALIPAIFGMIIGSKVRQKISNYVFTRILFCSLCLLGIYIISNNI